MSSSGKRIDSSMIVDGSIVNADVNNAAAIAYGKLALANSIVSGDIVDGTLVNADINNAAAIAYGKLNLANAVQTTDLVANAVTIHGQTALGGSTTTTTPTWATLGTTGARTYFGGVVRLDTVLILSSAGAAELGYLGYNIDGGADAQIGLTLVPAAGSFVTMTVFGLISLSLSGSHTVNLRWMTSAGISMTANIGSLFVVTEFKR